MDLEAARPTKPAFAADERILGGSTRFSICTIVSDEWQYDRMRRSFEQRGFAGSDCEFLYLDNTNGNRFDAYTGINLFLTAACGRYIIICHQDVELVADDRERLDGIIKDLDSKDPFWGLFGNAGGNDRGELVLRISDPHGEDQAIGGPFPAMATSLDENFLVIRQEANLAVSGDLAGFHLYGTDLVLVAERLGYRAYVADFHLRHHGRGTIDGTFFQARRSLVHKLGSTCRWRWITTTCTELPIVPPAVVRYLADSRNGLRMLKSFMKLRRWAAVLTGFEKRSSARTAG